MMFIRDINPPLVPADPVLSMSSSPTSHYPMMMLPSGQAVPVLPGPGQMPSVINVRLTQTFKM